MIDTALATSSLLSNQYGLTKGSGLVSGLLAPKASTEFSGLATLSSVYGASGGNAKTSLTKFVEDYVPNNGQLLKNLDAVFALQNILGTSELSSTAAFQNPYAQALALGDDYQSNESSLTSLLL